MGRRRKRIGLTGDRLGLVHRYMVDEPPPAPAPPPRWKPRRKQVELIEESAEVSAAAVAGPPDPSQVEISEANGSPVEAMPVDVRVEPPARPDPALEPDAAPDPPAMEEEFDHPVEPSAQSQPVPLPVEVLSGPVEKAPEETEPQTEPEPVARPVEAQTPAARELPIHEWVQVAEDSESNPAWPQELVRLGLERSRRRRDGDRAGS